MFKFKKLIIIFILFSFSGNFLYADNFSDVKTRVDAMKSSSIESGIFGEIITKFFGINGFLNFKFLGDFSSNYLLQFDGNKIINSIIYSDGINIGIGTGTPTEKLEISGNTKINGDLKGVKKISFDTGNNHRIDTNSSGLLFDGGDGSWDFLIYDERAYLGDIIIGYNDTATISTYDTNEDLIINPNGNGKVIINGDLETSGVIVANQFLYASDRKLKKNIKNLDYSLEKINKLQAVEFDWKNNNKKDIGLIAQDVEKVFPEFVDTRKSDGIKAVKYGNLVAPLIEAIKELTKKIEKLERENIELNKKIERIIN